MKLKLLQRKEPFFPLFLKQSDVLGDASRLLVEEARSYDQHVDLFAAEVLGCEHLGDELIRDILTRVNRGFSTPFEPEDVRLLASRLDDVLDGIEDVAYRIAAYRVPELPQAAVRLCEIIEACVRLIGAAIRIVGKASISVQCSEINLLETEADSVVRSGLAELMQRKGDALAVLKTKEIYEFLEGTVDRCEDVANVLQNIGLTTFET